MSESRSVKPGDTVTVRAKVLQVGPADIGLAVELFSKTDQYSAWIRADLIAEHIPAPAIPAEPEPGAYLIGDALCVRFPGDASPPHWLAGNTWSDWTGTWAEYGGPDVTITRLVPPPPEVEMPWTSGPFEVKRDGSPENRPDTCSVVLVHRGTANTVINQGASSTFMPAGRAEALAYALLAAARAAREAS